MARDQRLTTGRIHYPAGSDQQTVRSRLAFAGLSLIAVVVMGIGGYWMLGRGSWSLLDCAYMVVITITSVGYAEVLPVSEIEGGRIFTMVLLIAGMGVSVYFLSALTAFIIEGDLHEAIWRRRMQRRLDQLKDHYIVCGVGETGRNVVEELLHAGCQVVVIEQAAERVDAVLRNHPTQVVGIEGDATEDSLLIECGIERAAGLVTSLQNDRDNLFITVSARQLNPTLRIVSRAVLEQARTKLLRAGADAIVSPNVIGGRRMAQELLRPRVVGFLDMLAQTGPMASEDGRMSIELCLIGPTSSVVGRTLAEANLRQVANVLVLSAQRADTAPRIFNPPPELMLEAGMTLVILGEREAMAAVGGWLAGTE